MDPSVTREFKKTKVNKRRKAKVNARSAARDVAKKNPDREAGRKVLTAMKTPVKESFYRGGHRNLAERQATKHHISKMMPAADRRGRTGGDLGGLKVPQGGNTQLSIRVPKKKSVFFDGPGKAAARITDKLTTTRRANNFDKVLNSKALSKTIKTKAGLAGRINKKKFRIDFKNPR